jgi:hypothetical protein
MLLLDMGDDAFNFLESLEPGHGTNLLGPYKKILEERNKNNNDKGKNLEASK